ncbi:tpd52 like 2a isoform X5 [Pangasianodon hypophthalmus]|uniref:tpd52 like 2a isoform X5 n=1 Tax=Pangasianodon hypophthalmus TaxID=310915 RepID=UPI000F0060B0|nr:tpd52 like 2a isoform X5 [Pangasianodon hypophthalmus]
MQMDSGDRGSFTEGGASARTLPPGLTEQEAVELELELSKVEDEIQTLRHVLTAKERHAGELRRRLGISPLTELKSNLTKGWHEVQSSNAYLTASATLEDISRSDAYKKTQETLSQAGMMTSSAFSSLGSAIRSRLGEMRALTYTPPSGSYSMRHSLSMPTMRNSPTFKNLEDKMAGKGSTNGEDA